MRKVLRFIGFLILGIILIVLIIGLFAPKEMNVERTITMNAPKELVFNEVTHFKTWPEWSPWLQMDPEAKIDYFGVDGEAGSGYNWEGKKVGNGTMKNAGIEGTTMNYDLMFKGMFESKANGILKAEEEGATTRVTWTFHSVMSYPWNALGLILGGEKSLGKDFEKGLLNLKTKVESMPVPTPQPVVDTTITDSIKGAM